MAIDFLRAKKRQRYLILILALVICLILVVIWQGFLKSAGPPAAVAPPVFFPTEIKIKWEVLQDARLSQLQPFVPIPAFEEEVGREDPFISY